MVCWSSFSNCWKLGIRYSNLLVWLIFNKSWNICKDLYRYEQIRTETFLKTSNKRCFFRRALFNQLISLSKTEFMTIQFSNNPAWNICQDLCRFVQNRRECSTWVLRQIPFSFFLSAVLSKHKTNVLTSFGPQSVNISIFPTVCCLEG